MTAIQRPEQALFLTRLFIGLVQGCLIYWAAELRVYDPQQGFEKDQWKNFVTMVRTLAVLAPLPLIFGVGNLPILRLAVWSVASILLLAIVGWLAPAPVWSGAPPVVTVWLFSLIVIYIIHEFFQAAQNDGRAIARYETYFDISWRHGFQAVLALIFVLAFWAVVSLGAWLFRIIGIHWVYDTVFSAEFGWIASAAAFALGIHWTDAASDLTRGVRQIGLALLAWLALLMTVILAAFLVTLVFTGLQPLWDTNNATVLLLNAAAVMILLVNAAFQAGTPPDSPLIKSIVRFSPLPLAGIVLLAALGLWLRVNQYGLTPARVLAGAELLVVGFYAAGYLAAIFKPGQWMALVKPVNIAGAAFVAAMLIALMTPIADPARLSVANQLARLDSGRVEPEDFDFGFLASERSRHWGQTALANLKARSGSDRDDRIAQLADRLSDPLNSYYDRGEHSFNERRNALRLVGPGTIPDAALLPSGTPDPIGNCLNMKRQFDQEVAYAKEQRRKAENDPSITPMDLPTDWHDGLCPVRLMDLDADGDLDLLIWTNRYDWSNRGGRNVHSSVAMTALVQRDSDLWVAEGSSRIRRPYFETRDSKLKSDNIREYLETLESQFAAAIVVPPIRQDIQVDGHRLRLNSPQKPVQSRIQMRQHLNMLDNREPPMEILRDVWLENLLSTCADDIERKVDPTLACYGTHMDITGDGTEEFLLIKLAQDIQNTIIQAYGQSAERWILLGQGEVWQPDTLKLNKIDDKVERAQRLRDARAKLLSSLTTSIPLLSDLEFDGTRIIFEYSQPKLPSKDDASKGPAL